MLIVPKGLLLHSMSEYIVYKGKVLYAKNFLQTIGLTVHGFIQPDGTYDSWKTSPLKTYHAGKSKWGGLNYLNSHFLGVELLVPGVNDWGSFKKKINTKGTYTKNQFDTAVNVFKFWMDKYNIPIDMVCRHSDCSGDDIRGKNKGKIDPGSAFDWEVFKTALTK